MADRFCFKFYRSVADRLSLSQIGIYFRFSLADSKLLCLDLLIEYQFASPITHRLDPIGQALPADPLCY